jgi:hypothetical protein
MNCTYIINFQQYIAACKTNGNNDKDWNIPKMHSHTHVFSDIMAKGATINYNTKPNEGTHGGPKDTYRRISNGKEFEDLVRFSTLVNLTANNFSCFR